MGRLKETKRWKRWLPLVAMLTVFTVGLARNNWSMAQDATTAAPAAAEAAPATPPPATPDSTGATAGGVADVPVADAAKGLTLNDVADRVGKNKISINIVWTLITGFLVMFMQAGFALVETGLCRAKNSAHTMAMNFMIYPLGMLGFYVCGFAFMFGGLGAVNGGPAAPTLGASTAVLDSMYSITLAGKQINLIGFKGFFLGPSVYDCGIFALFLFQMVFMDTTATIPTGTMAERWKFSAFVLYGCAIGTIMYPVYGCWVWGGGWLSQLGNTFGLGHGTVDFAGSSVVHMQGGVIALVGGWLVGARIGKYNKDGSVNPMPPHNIPMAMLGTFILAFGWFGFNPGSTLSGTDDRIAIVATNTMLASATGAFACYLWMIWARKMKPDPSMLCNGMLAGLVAITAPCAFVNSAYACITGLVAGVLVVESVFFIDRVLKVDDCVGAISVHGTCGAWGVLALGLFSDGTYGQGWNGSHLFKLADGTLKYIGDITQAPKDAVEQGVTGWFYGNPSQFFAECMGIIACFVYLAIATTVVMKVCGALTGGIRVSPEEELEGLDMPEMGVLGYSGIQMDKSMETPVSH